MCLAKAFFGEDEKEELIMEDISAVRVNGEKLNFRSLFGEQKEIDGTIKEINFQSGRIIVEQVG